MKQLRNASTTGSEGKGNHAVARLGAPNPNISESLHGTTEGLVLPSNHRVTDGGLMPMFTLWHPSFASSKPYDDFPRRWYPSIDVMAATFEAARIVVAWELGIGFDYAAIRLLLGHSFPPAWEWLPTSVTMLKPTRAPTDAEWGVLSYAGSVAYACHSHKKTEAVLEKFGQGDWNEIDALTDGLPAWSSKDLWKEDCAKIARGICGRFRPLIDEIALVLLKNGRVEEQEFLNLVKARMNAEAVLVA